MNLSRGHRKDRLAGFCHDSDLQCLDQAILVPQENPVDIDEIERWSKGEGKFREFETIRMRLEKKA